MKILLIFAACFYLGAAGYSKTCNCGWTNMPKTRIVGGVETKKNQYPWMVAIMEKTPEWSQFCGGSIITGRHILTAGHCAFRRTPDVLGVVAGQHDLKEWKEFKKDVILIAKTIMHEDYGDQLLFNDIAILFTTKKMDFSEIIGPICLPNRKLTLDNQYLKAMGWGLTTNNGWASNVLKEVDLKVVPSEACRKDWAGKMYSQSTQLCTREKGKDSCNQDSGGPLVWMNPDTKRYVLAALVSYGDQCAGPKAGVNTDVSAYLGWVDGKVTETDAAESICTGY